METEVIIIKNNSDYIKGLIGTLLEKGIRDSKIRFEVHNKYETCYVPNECWKFIQKDKNGKN